MMLGRDLLIIDDDVDLVVLIRDLLEGHGHTVHVAHEGLHGLKLARALRPTLILLDVMMPGMDGYEICRKLKDDPKTSQILVLMVTAKGQIIDKVTGLNIGADDYVAKPFDKRELEARVESLLRRAPFPYDLRSSGERCTMEVSLSHGQIIHATLRGTNTFATATRSLFSMDERAIETLARRANRAQKSPEWRLECKNIGEILYEQISGSNVDVVNCYSRAQGIVPHEGDLHVVFKSPREFLRLPLELAFGESEYLALRHPLSRLITGNHARRQPISVQTLRSFFEEGERLRVLLVASNTGNIAGVDEEVDTIREMFAGNRVFRGVGCDVTHIPTSMATYDRIREELRRCRYHIVHYAGHGGYSAASPEESALYFWEAPQRCGRIVPLTAVELATLLTDSETRLVYLGCCCGTASGSSVDLVDSELLGLADSVLHGGVPAVVGARWPISDPGAKELAVAFYCSLGEQGEIDTALLDAKREAGMRDKNDKSWLSPILVMQA